MTDDEQIEKDQLLQIVTNYLTEAYQARRDLLNEKSAALDLLVRKLKDESNQLELKTIRVNDTLRRSSLADLRAYHALFTGRETP